MKILIITVLSFCFINATLYAQDKVSNVVVEMGLPSNLEKLSEQKTQNLIKERKKSEINFSRSKGSIYKSGNIIVQTNGSAEKLPQNLLEERKIFYDDYSKRISSQKNYTSTIKKHNNYSALIVNYDNIEGFSYYLLYAVNNNNDKSISVRIEYEKTDEVKAQKIVDDVLKKLQFR